VQTCPSCGEENPDRFRLCGICGTPLAPAAPARQVRKTVTIVYSDLKGSTTLGERLDTETVREVLSVYFADMQAVLQRHGGTVEKFIGDAIMAVFGLPTLHEDDALRAVRAAFEMKQALEAVNETLEARWGVRLENRTGVNTGEVVAGDVTTGQRLVTGDAVNTAARLEQAAPVCEILIGEPTYRLVRDAVEAEPVEPLALKGKAEPVRAYLLRGVKRADEGISRRWDAPMVGRSEELQVLIASLARAEAERRAQLVTVLGPAGVGKSRLLREFLARAGEGVLKLRGHCLSYGDGISFWPLAEVVRQAAGIGDDDPLEEARRKLSALAGEQAVEAAERVAAAIGLSDSTFPVEETFWGARRLLETLAAVRPAIVVIDDIHWAEDTFLDLIRYVIDGASAPLVLVCSSRPDLLESHAEWVQETDRIKRLILEPLSQQESSRVVENLLGTSMFDARIRTKIIEAAEGNPLFVEQMVSMLIDDGILIRDPTGGWLLTSDIDRVTIPPSISALLTSRIDRLSGTERAVIERAAVIGSTFFRGAVEDLAPPDVRPNVDEALTSLLRKELIQPGSSEFAGQATYRFVHVLIRDAAYGGLLKRQRAELHERFVDWLERQVSDRVLEFEEIRGYHLEQAFRILVELAPMDDRARGLGARGSRYLSSSGRRALARGDMPAAANLLKRAADLLPPGDPERLRLLLESGEALLEVGELSLAGGVLAEAIQGAAAVGDRALETTARMALLDLRYATDPERTAEAIGREVQEAIPVLERLGAHEGLARAWRLLTRIRWTAGRNSEAEESALRTMEHARLAGDTVLETRFSTSLVSIARYGPRPVPQAVEECERLLERSGHDRRVRGLTLGALAHLKAMQGRFEEARELYRESRAIFEEYGWNLLAALASLDSAVVELLADDPVAAESELRRDFESLERMGERNYISTISALLAEALYRQGRYEEAEGLSRVSEELAAADDVTSQVMWRSVRSKVLARRGTFEEAVTLAREAVRRMDESDEPDSQGDALVDLAEVLELAGKVGEAAGVLEQALDLFRAKGNSVSADRVRRRVAALPG